MLSWSLLLCRRWWWGRWLLAWNQNKHSILHISYTDSEISIGLSYNRPYSVWWFQLHHCANLVRDFPTSILALAAVRYGMFTFHINHFGAIMVLRISSEADFRSFEHIYMRPEVNSNRFQISDRFEKSFCSHDNFTAGTYKW